ncbi:DUF3348 domain-containing protein [Ideonella azotifigens]|uniref:DUF3348 domain-containing protein n=1 Tax=Ideonella azotifigens TaxID=513160 RepID=A0ABN1KKQ1_9BURK
MGTLNGSKAQVTRRPLVTGSALVRLLAALTDAADVPASKAAFAERLSGWVDWRDAISLSAALNSAPAVAPTPPPRTRALPPATAAEREYRRVRAELTTLVEQAPAGKTEPRPLNPTAAAKRAAPEAAALDFPSYRQRYLAAQQAMDAQISTLRERLQAALATQSPEMARLAALDVAMAPIIGAQEQALLASLPASLGVHFERLRRAQAAEATLQTEPEATPSTAWLDHFCQDMRALLLAELDHRMQPLEGLLAALRGS